MNTLRLHIDSGWPEQHANCNWTLLTPLGQTLQHGRSEPQHWPRDEGRGLTVEVVLTADQAGCLVVDLPSGKNGANQDIMAFAAEERLCGEIENFHLVRGRSLGGQRWEVIAIPRRRIRELITYFATQGLPPDRMVVEADVLLPAPETWVVRWSGSNAWLRLPGTWVALTVSDEPPAELTWCLTQSTEQAPREIRILLDNGQSINEVRWHDTLEVTLTISHDLPSNRGETNLLQGEFVPARQRDALWRAYRNPLLTAGITALFWLVTLFVEWGWLTWRSHDLRQQTAQVFRDTMPTSTVLVDPVLQIRRELDTRRLHQGLAVNDDFLVLVAALSGHTGDLRLRQLRYEDRILEVGLSTEKRVTEALRKQLETVGLNAEIRSGKGGDESSMTYLAVSRKKDGKP